MSKRISVSVGSYWIEWQNCRLVSDFYFVCEIADDWLVVQRVGNPCKVHISAAKIAFAIEGNPEDTGLFRGTENK